MTSDMSALLTIQNPISLDSIMMFAPVRDNSQWATDRYGHAIPGCPDLYDPARRVGYEALEDFDPSPDCNCGTCDPGDYTCIRED